ncbi:hypothetical protein [Sporosarcina ureilytica]|nr:hypothetical protein [Sporosarcina ureilytica]
MNAVNMGDIVFTTIFILLIILFFVSFTVFIKKCRLLKGKEPKTM